MQEARVAGGAEFIVMPMIVRQEVAPGCGDPTKVLEKMTQDTVGNMLGGYELRNFN